MPNSKSRETLLDEVQRKLCSDKRKMNRLPDEGRWDSRLSPLLSRTAMVSHTYFRVYVTEHMWSFCFSTLWSLTFCLDEEIRTIKHDFCKEENWFLFYRLFGWLKMDTFSLIVSLHQRIASKRVRIVLKSEYILR